MRKIFLFIFCFAAILVTISKANLVSKQNFIRISLSNIEAIANNEGGDSGTSCTATYTCVSLSGQSNGSVSCTGQKCSRGTESGGIFGQEKRYVECDGVRTYC